MNSVSVIVTFYNSEKYVDVALKSVMDQKTDFVFDVIVGDDGSSDGTMAAVQKWIDRYPGRIRAFVRSRDDGVTLPGFRASRNRLSLLEHVTGKYFIFLDGDDYFTDNDKLQKQYDILEAPENQDCVACSHYIEALYPDGHTKQMPAYKLPERKFSLKEYWALLYFHTDTSLVRSSVIKGFPTDYAINNFNDNLITYLVVRQGKLYFLPETMAVYLQTGDGVWTAKNAVVNYIRNMYMYDMCITLNPEIRKEIDVRLYKDWKYLYKHRREIGQKDTAVLLDEAKERNHVFSLLFLTYDSLGFSKKMKLFFRKNAVSMHFWTYKLLRKAGIRKDF